MTNDPKFINPLRTITASFIDSSSDQLNHRISISPKFRKDGRYWCIKSGPQEAAIGEGLSLEETVARVALPEFRGYALFDWVHPGLNVPAAYKDLSK